MRILIVSALEAEVLPLIRRFSLKKIPIHSGSHDVFAGSIFSHAVTCAVVGPGKIESMGTLTQILAQENFDAAVIYGYAGSLDPRLSMGDVVTATILVSVQDTCRIEVPLAGLASGRVHDAQTLVSLDHIAANHQERIDLAHQYQANAVDMESFYWAKALMEKGICYGVIRGISDDLTLSLPSELPNFLDKNGKMRWRKTLAIILMKPKIWPAIFKIRNATRKAQIEMQKVLKDFLKVLETPSDTLRP